MQGLIDAVFTSNVNAVREALRAPGVIGRLNIGDPLVIAAAYPSPEIVEILLRAGASPNVRFNATGTTPLLRAVDENYEAHIPLLIGSGADTNAVNNTGITPLYAAQTTAIVAMLLAVRANPRLPGAVPCLIGPAVRGDVDVTEALIAAGADTSAVSPRSGWTPLHTAAQNCHPEVLHVLLAAGADALATDNKGKTPLRCIHFGTPQQRQAITAALVAAGDRNWDHVSTPCAGLQRALVPTWKHAPNELHELFKRLKREVQARAQAALKIFHP